MPSSPTTRRFVCAAVSAILQAARLGLEEYAGIALEARQRTGDFSIRWPERDRDDDACTAIVATAELAVAQIARQYPGARSPAMAKRTVSGA